MAGTMQTLVYGLLGLCGVLVLIVGVRRGNAVDLLTGVGMLAILVLVSPPVVKRIVGLFPKPVPAEQVAAARVVIYHRPLCRYCARLSDRLGRARGDALWVNIWRDPDAAARVREYNGGNELVPTVVIDGVPHSNPDPRVVIDALQGEER